MVSDYRILIKERRTIYKTNKHFFLSFKKKLSKIYKYEVLAVIVKKTKCHFSNQTKTQISVYDIFFIRTYYLGTWGFGFENFKKYDKTLKVY